MCSRVVLLGLKLLHFPEKLPSKSSEMETSSQPSQPEKKNEDLFLLPHELRAYTLHERVGRGFFSYVYIATRKVDLKILAIKVVPKANLKSTGDTKRFQREIDVIAFLKHDNIIALLDFFEDYSFFYLVMDYCPGGNLLEYTIKVKKLSETDALCVFYQILSAVHYCHLNGVAHRDLKPANILVYEFPNVKVSDFGLCGYIKEEKLMSTFCGSPCYCSPECLQSHEYDGRKSDVWSLGIILYEILTGMHPWNVKNTAMMLRQISCANFKVPEYVSDPLREIIQSCVVADPESRITCAELLQNPIFNIARAKLKKKNEISSACSTESLPPLLQAQKEDSVFSKSVVSPFNRAGSKRGPLKMPMGVQRKSVLKKRLTASSSDQNIMAKLPNRFFGSSFLADNTQ